MTSYVNAPQWEIKKLLFKWLLSYESYESYGYVKRTLERTFEEVKSQYNGENAKH